jgi:hypothetical protein
MKKIIVIIGLAALAFSAQAQSTTNNITVVLNSGNDDVLRKAWQFDNQCRIAGVYPYSSVQATNTFRAYAETLASDGLNRKLDEIQRNQEGEFLHLFKNATPGKRLAALQALQ